jgi:hypothetical protein
VEQVTASEFAVPLVGAFLAIGATDAEVTV